MARELDALIEEAVRHAEAHETGLLLDAVQRFLGNAVGSGIPVSGEQCRTILDALQSVRAFPELAETADRLIRIGHDEPIVHIRYAQALIDGGRPVAALAGLERLLARIAQVHPDRVTVLGLLGRAHKQIYVDHRAPARPPSIIANLKAAIRYYGDAFSGGSIAHCHWHGINLVALLARAGRDGVPGFEAAPYRELAKRITAALTPIAGKEAADPWLLASLGEAALALGDFAAAARWYEQFADHAGTRAFNLASALRQLQEVWQIAIGPAPEGALVAALKARLLSLEDGAVRLSARDRLGIEGYGEGVAVGEAVLGADLPLRIAWLKSGLTAARSVGRIRDRHSRETHGTGFLVKGGDIHASLGDELLLMTNTHVISDGSEASALVPAYADVLFDEADRLHPHPCLEVIWQSPVAELDAVLLRIGGGDGLQPLPIAPLDYLPASIDQLPAARARAIVIGHAEGQDLAVSLADTRILDIGYRRPDRTDIAYLHYRTPTEPGSSGSPVFEGSAWQVIALHHAGPGGREGIRKLGGRKGFNQANEGVLMRSIAEGVRRDRKPRWFSAQGGAAAPAAPGLEGIGDKLMAIDVSERELKGYLKVDMARSEAFRPTIVSATAGALAAFAPPAPPFPATLTGGFAPEGLPVSVMEGFNRIARWRRHQLYQRKIKAGWAGRKFVSEGDSWFQYPFVLEDVIDQLFDEHAIYCLAGAGHTLQSMGASEELIEGIKQEKPDGVLLSGGGNDLLGEGTIKLHLKDFDPKLKPEDYPQPSLDDHLRLMADFFDTIFKRVLGDGRQLRVFCHGYDWAFPNAGKGGWLARPMAEKGIKDAGLQRQLVRILIDRFNAVMLRFEETYRGQVFFVDCRGSVGPEGRWYDELHPNDQGFALVADRFRRRIAQAFGGTV